MKEWNGLALEIKFIYSADTPKKQINSLNLVNNL